jgi:hypothetical protein
MLLSCTEKSVSGEVVLVGSDALRRARLASIALRSTSQQLSSHHLQSGFWTQHDGFLGRSGALRHREAGAVWRSLAWFRLPVFVSIFHSVAYT